MGNLFDDENLVPPKQDQEFADEQFQDQFLDEDQEPIDADEHISDALKRIEQAQLYKTLLTHNMFAPGSARPEIQAVVEREIREFATTRLEILVGIKSEAQAPVAAAQFTAEEVGFIKSLFQRAQQRSGGAASQPNPQINPVSAAPQAIVQTTPAVRSVQPQRKQVAPTRRTGPAAQEKRARKPTKPGLDNIGAKSGKNYTQAGNPNALPMPSAAVMAQKASAEATKNASAAGAIVAPGGANKTLDGDALGALTNIFIQKNADVKED